MHALAELLRVTCDRWGNAPCLSDQDRTLNYAEVADLTDRLAQVLARDVANYAAPRPRTGFAPLPVVASGGIDLYLLFFASIKAGRAFLPISPALTGTNIKGILDALGLEPRVHVGPGISVEGIENRPMAELFARASEEAHSIALSPADDRNAVTYQTTSGTTGTPKVIPISGENCLFQNELSLKVAGHRPGQTQGICGDWVPRQFLAAFSVGACNSFCNVSKASRAEIIEWMQGQRIGYLTVYPNALKIIAQVGEVFPELEWVLAGGEALSSSHVRAFEGMTLPGAKLINCYASQEAGILCSYTHHHGDAMFDGAWPVGPSVKPGRVDILDHSGVPVVDDEEGAIVVRCGANLVTQTGYLGGSREIKQLPDGAYVTGDRGYRDAQGNVYVTGRSDDVVQINSYFIALGEIEKALLGLPGVSDAVVKTVDLNQSTRVLVAYFEGSAQEAAVKQALAGSLPSFMCPHFVLRQDAFPRGPTGKVLKRFLPFEPSSFAASGIAECNSPMAREIRGLWSALLSHSGFDDNSRFFDVGGDSLSAVQLAIELERRFGHRIEIAEFLTAGASIDGLVGMLEQRGISRHSTRPTPHQPVTSDAILARNAEIMSEWAPREKLSSTGQFICETDGRGGPALFWLLQGKVEYVALAEAFADIDLYAARSFANLSGQLDVTGTTCEEDLYHPYLLNPVAAKLAQELLSLANGRRFVLGGNCQSTLIIEAMIGAMPQIANLLDGAVLLNPIRPFSVGPAPVSLLFGAEELFEFEQAHGAAKGAFLAPSIEVVPGTHGTYFQGAALPRIVETLRRTLHLQIA